MHHLPVKRPVFPTVPLLYAKDQCEALSEGEIDGGTSFISDNGNTYFKCVSILIEVNFTEIRASVTLYTCDCFSHI